MELSTTKFLNIEELLSSVQNEDVRKYIKDESDFWQDQNASKIAQKWLKFAKENKNTIRVTEYEVPKVITSNKFNVALSDFKVDSNRRPDDKVYNAHEYLRQNVARGNSVLYIHNLQTNEVQYDGVIFALRKFIGGDGDDDDDIPDSNTVWQKYFTQKVNSAVNIVCTEKANGEAAHLSARFINDQFYLILGSKNVHLMIGKVSDLDLYTDGRYQIAKQVGSATLDLISRLEVSKLEILLSFLHHTKSTAVFEVLQPTYQHVVDLTYLGSSPELKFITWTSAFKNLGMVESLCSIRPDSGIQFAQQLGMSTVKCDLISVEDFQERFDSIRKGYGYEGEVLYYLDSKGQVIGLLKRKTAWYVILRAIREKAASALAAFKKEPSMPPSTQAQKAQKRLQEIKEWLGFSSEYLEQWIKLSDGFMTWIHTKFHKSEIDQKRGVFPSIWKQYLSETQQSDKIMWD